VDGFNDDVPWMPLWRKIPRQDGSVARQTAHGGSPTSPYYPRTRKQRPQVMPRRLVGPAVFEGGLPAKVRLSQIGQT
jgi:hypothetical protein